MALLLKPPVENESWKLNCNHINLALLCHSYFWHLKNEAKGALINDVTCLPVGGGVGGEVDKIIAWIGRRAWIKWPERRRK